MWVGVCLSLWIWVSLHRLEDEKKEVNDGKVIPEGKAPWCLEHHVQIAWRGVRARHTFHSVAPAHLPQLHFLF